MLHALLIDDEASARAELRGKLAAHRDVAIVGEAATVLTARPCSPEQTTIWCFSTCSSSVASPSNSCIPARAGLFIATRKPRRPSPKCRSCSASRPAKRKFLSGWRREKTSPEIAVIVGHAPATVKKQVENITAKLGVETRLAAALNAMEVLGLPQK